MEISIRVATMEDIPALQELIPESARGLSSGLLYLAADRECNQIYLWGGYPIDCRQDLLYC